MPPETDKSKKVVGHAKDSVAGFANAFDAVRQHRGAGAGAPTDEEQDLARAALVFAAAGLDSCIKHLIKDSITSLAEFDSKVKDQLNKFVRKLLESETNDRIASALLADSPRIDLIDSYIYELTGSSLQSFEELAKAAGALGINVQPLVDNKTELVRIFKMRNKIIHELDVNFDGGVGQRERNSRSKDDLVADSNLLLTVADGFVGGVEHKLENRG